MQPERSIRVLKHKEWVSKTLIFYFLMFQKHKAINSFRLTFLRNLCVLHALGRRKKAIGRLAQWHPSPAPAQISQPALHFSAWRAQNQCYYAKICLRQNLWRKTGILLTDCSRLKHKPHRISTGNIASINNRANKGGEFCKSLQHFTKFYNILQKCANVDKYVDKFLTLRLEKRPKGV